MSNEQAMTKEAEVEQNVSTEESGASEPDLDSLLSEFDESESSKEEPKVEQPASDDVQWLKAQRVQYEKEQQDKALSEAAGIIKETLGELPIQLPEYALKGILQQKAYEDSDGRLIKAFNNRFSQPEKWKSIVKAIGKQVSKDFAPKDTQATNSWNAVESAVHSASTSSSQNSSEPNLKEMSDQEFAAYKKKLFGR